MADSVLNAPLGFAWVKRLSSWRLDNNRLLMDAVISTGEGVVIEFSHVSKRIWRMQFIPDGGSIPDLGILAAELPPMSLQVVDDNGALIVSGVDTSLRIEREPWCVSLLDNDDGTVCRENPYDVDGLNRLFVLPLGYVRDQQGKVTRITESLHLCPDEHLYGLGEKFTHLDKVGQRITSWTVDALGAASERAYKNVPFLISSKGYGLFINTGRRCVFELGTESCETYSIQVDGPYLDLFIIAGASPANILHEYASLTGYAPVPPKWSFGVWLSGSGVYRDAPAVRNLMKGIDDYDIPCDVIHIDPWWMRWRKYADFQWDQQAFPDPDGLISDLHADRLHLSLWQHPYISVESDLFKEGQRKGYFVSRPDGEVYVIDYGLSLSTLPGSVTEIADESLSWNARVAIIDLTDQDAVEWYKSLMRQVLQQGVDVYKTDFGEDIPADAHFANGMTGAEMHNLYPLYYNRVVYEVTQEIRGDGLVWSRSGWAGSQRYPTCWSGDPACEWDSMAFTLRGGLSLGMSGIPFWSHDVGGYRGRPSEKLYIRWAQFGMFCSHVRCHGESQREPWFFGERALDIFRRYASLRYQLFPYLYACAHEANHTGMPVVRAMTLAFPDDPNCYNIDSQYMFGPWLLVAPMLDERDQRSVYLPEGGWVDYWSGQNFQGPGNLKITIPLDRLPLYVRRGAVIPMMKPAKRIPQALVDPLILDIYPSKKIGYQFIEDEGTTDFVGELKAHELEFSWDGPVEREFILRFHLDWEPTYLQLFTVSSKREMQWETSQVGVVEIGIPTCRSARIRIGR